MIQVESLHYTYPGSQKPVIRDLSFSLDKGEIVGFLGPSGAGKSTTQNILVGLLTGYEGSVQVMNRDVKNWGRDYYEYIGVSFELPNHFLKLTARENLDYFKRLYSGTTRTPDDALALFGLQDDADTRVSAFSKGMQNRLTLARAFLHKPEILFLDEPTSGLDPVNARMVKDTILEEKRNGTTVFLTTHNMLDADELCDRVAFIVDGSIVLMDAPRVLKLRHGERRIRVEFRGEQGTRQQEFPLEGIGDNIAFADILQTERIETIHSLETTLESIFLHVTGRSLS